MPVDADGPPTPKALADELERLVADCFRLSAEGFRHQGEEPLRHYLRYYVEPIIAALRELEQLRHIMRILHPRVHEQNEWLDGVCSVSGAKAAQQYLAEKEADPASHEATKGDEDE